MLTKEEHRIGQLKMEALLEAVQKILLKKNHRP